MTDGYWLVLVGASGLSPLEELEAISQSGLVVDLIMIDGSTSTGVLIGLSSASLIVEGWDSQAGGPNGELLTAVLSEVAGVWVP
jgi:hypothetical protein